MTPALAHEPYEPTFVVATIPAAVRDAIKRIVQARAELTEAPLVATRASITSPGAPALVILSADPTAVSALEGDLRGVLQRHVRPKIVLLSPDDPDLPLDPGPRGRAQAAERAVSVVAPLSRIVAATAPPHDRAISRRTHRCTCQQRNVE